MKLPFVSDLNQGSFAVRGARLTTTHNKTFSSRSFGLDSLRLIGLNTFSEMCVRRESLSRSLAPPFDQSDTRQVAIFRPLAKVCLTPVDSSFGEKTKTQVKDFILEGFEFNLLVFQTVEGLQLLHSG